MCKIHQTLQFLSFKKINTESSRSAGQGLILHRPCIHSQPCSRRSHMSRTEPFIVIRPLVIVVVNNTVKGFTGASPVGLRHAAPTPNSRGHRSDHTSLKARHADRRSSNTGWSQITGLGSPQASRPKVHQFLYKCEWRLVKTALEALENSSSDLTDISTLLWFSIDAVQSNIYIQSHTDRLGCFLVHKQTSEGIWLPTATEQLWSVASINDISANTTQKQREMVEKTLVAKLEHTGEDKLILW